MKTMSSSLSDVLKSLMQALRVSSVLPATVFVLFNCLLLFPEFDIDSPSTVILALTTILVLSYLLYAFNAPLIRLAEGYPFRFEWLGRHLTEQQKKSYQHCLEEIGLADDMVKEIKIRQAHLSAEYGLSKPMECADYRKLEQWKRKWRIRKDAARQILYYHYPDSADHEADIVPTLLGNTIASFESYPFDRYGIDAVIMWPRIVPILQEEEFIPFVENEKTVFDFLLNLAFLVLLLAIEVGFFIPRQSPMKGLVGSTILVLIAYILYRAEVISAVNWGGTIAVAFDLYRDHLRNLLHLRKPISLDQEQKDWRNLSRFYIRGGSFEDFVYEEDQNLKPSDT
jgi:hypothetical protein